MWIENSKLRLTNAAHEHFTTQTGRKSKTALKNFMGPWGRGAEGRHMQPRADIWRRGPRAEKNKYPISYRVYILSKELYIYKSLHLFLKFIYLQNKNDLQMLCYRLSWKLGFRMQSQNIPFTTQKVL